MRGYDAIEKTSAVIDRSGEGRVRVTGPDRVTWLQGLLTNDVAALAPGGGCYAAYLTPQGRMITDVRVLRVDGFADWGDRLLLDLPGSRKADVLERFEQFIITEDVTLEDVTAPLARVGLHGRGVWQTLFATVDVPVVAIAGQGVVGHDNPLPEHSNLVATFHGQPILVAGSRDLGVPGVDLYVASSATAELLKALVASGAVEMDDEAWEARRIEAGRPRFGLDMTDDTIPLEAGIEDRAISFSKGCYVGQEIIVRVTTRGGGRVARRLVGLSLADAASALAPIRHGMAIHSGDKQIGHVTSAAFSPRFARWIAMGYVHRDFVTPGAPVHIVGDDVRVDATISELPFVADPVAH